MVETVSAKDYEQLKTMKKNTPRLKPVVRGHSEVFRRSRNFWLGKTKKTTISPEKDSEKVLLELAKRVCLEECKFKIERKGKEIECGKLCSKNHTQFADAKTTKGPSHQS